MVFGNQFFGGQPPRDDPPSYFQRPRGARPKGFPNTLPPTSRAVRQALPPRPTLRPKPHCFIAPEYALWPAQPFALRLGRLQAAMDALPDGLVFQLGEGGWGCLFPAWSRSGAVAPSGRTESI